jgi:Ni2+-binding GTPase involved in maturation of urease and hydrogenase
VGSPGRRLVLVSGAPGAGKTSLTPEMLAEYDRPVGIGELITVDTTAPVDVAALARTRSASLSAPV